MLISGFINLSHGEYYYVLHSSSISILLIGPMWYIKIAGSSNQSESLELKRKDCSFF